MPGRNEKCPCGSGKKYKACCLRAQEAAVTGWTAEVGDVDRLSNRVVDLIEAGLYGEAEEICALLRVRYPEEIDHVYRLGQVREVQGRYAEAAVLRRQAARWAQEHPGYDEEVVLEHQRAAERLERRARGDVS